MAGVAPGSRTTRRLVTSTSWAARPSAGSTRQLYQFHYQVLKDELGEDPNLMNQAAQPRVAASNIEASRVLANNATEYMYDAYIYVMEETCKKVSCLLNKSVTYGSKKYRDILKEEDVKDPLQKISFSIDGNLFSGNFVTVILKSCGNTVITFFYCVIG